MTKASDLVVHPATWHSQELLTSGSFTVPNNVYEIFASGCGAGAGGSGSKHDGYSTIRPGYPGSAAGGVYRRPIKVTPGQSIAVNIGAGGAGGTGTKTQTSTGVAGSAGGITIIGSLVLEGGKAGPHYVSGTTPIPTGGFATSLGPGAVLPQGAISGASQHQPCGVYKANNGSAGIYGDGPTGANNAGANTGAGGAGGAGGAANNGTTGGSGYVLLEWLI